MTPAQFRAARKALGLTAEGLAREMRVGSLVTIYNWESGKRSISGTVKTALECVLIKHGLNPEDFGIS